MHRYMQKGEPLYRIFLVVMSKRVNQLVSERKTRRVMQVGTRGRRSPVGLSCQCYRSTIFSPVTLESPAPNVVLELFTGNNDV